MEKGKNKVQGRIMTELKEFLEKNIDNDFRRILISNARKKEGTSKMQVRPVLVKDQVCYQVTRTCLLYTSDAADD